MRFESGLVTRRSLLGGALALSAGSLIAPGAAFASMAEKRLAFRNIHNNEHVDARFWGASGYDPQGLAEIDHGLRDWRTGDIITMDRSLLDLLVTLRDSLDLSARTSFDIISGYRSPKTNAALHERSNGVATKSQHMLGKATDIALPGVRLETVRTAALALKRGGVGYYPKSGFVHVDTGRVRAW